jgi:hypothetical protein
MDLPSFSAVSAAHPYMASIIAVLDAGGGGLPSRLSGFGFRSGETAINE